MRRIKINKKGFTLIEMLGAVAILGIIATIGIVSVSKVIQSAHKKFDNTQYDSFMQAAETYFSDNKSNLPLTPMEWKEISLQELINKKYIEKLLDSNKEEFDFARSKVRVTRLTSGKYQYEAILYRKKGDPIGEISNKVVNQNSRIKFELLKKNSYYSENKTYYARDYPVVDITISDTDQLSGYQYIIYRNGKQFKKSENIELSGGESKKDSVTLGKEFSYGKYSIKVVVYDKSGNKTTSSTDDSGKPDDDFSIYIDRTKPNCAISVAGIVGDNGWYKAEQITLTLNDTDKESGILKHGLQPNNSFSGLSNITKYEKIETQQGNTKSTTYYAHVEDKAGNVCETNTTVKVDTDSPSCSIKLSTGATPKTSQWYNKYNRSEVEPLKLEKGEKGPSGINRYILAMKDSNLSKNYPKYYSNNDTLNAQEGQNYYYGYVRDYAGNDVNCSTFIKMDVTDPDCPTTGYISYTPLPDRKDSFLCCKETCEVCYKPIPMSPNVTFIWSNLSYDTIRSEVTITEHDSWDRWTHNDYGNDYVSYEIAGKERFKGYYEGKIVVYDEAGNDNQGCEVLISEPANIRDDYSCEQANGNWYNEEGVEVSYDVYKKACLGEYYCEYADGNYYDSNGNIVSSVEYDASCNPHYCEKVGSKYFDSSGNVVTETKYHESCDEPSPTPDPDPDPEDSPPKKTCDREGNNYYDKDGNKVSEAEYLTSCNIKVDLKCPEISANAGGDGKWTNEEVTLTFKNFGSGVVKYEWWTSKNDAAYELKTGNNNPNTTTSKTLGVGKIKGKLVLIGADGSKQECYTSTYKIDKVKPTCGEATVSFNNGESSNQCNGHKWHKGVKKVTVEWDCSDEGDVKSTIENKKTMCVKEIENLDDFEGEKVIKKEIKDKAGNTQDCSKTVYIDNKPPTIGNCKINESDWKTFNCYKDYPGTPKTVLRPVIKDGGSGYRDAYYSWDGGNNQVPDRGAHATYHECMASANANLKKFQYRNLCDCVGNCTSQSLQTVHCNK